MKGNERAEERVFFFSPLVVLVYPAGSKWAMPEMPRSGRGCPFCPVFRHWVGRKAFLKLKIPTKGTDNQNTTEIRPISAGLLLLHFRLIRGIAI